MAIPRTSRSGARTFALLAVPAAILIATTTPACAQDGGTAAPPAASAAADSFVTAAGRRDGEMAAHDRGVARYFVGGFVSGVAIGLAGPVALGEDKPDAPPMAVAGAGLAGLVGTTAVAARSSAAVPRDAEQDIRDRDPAYRQAFRDAYAAQLRSRRKRATLWGGATGAAVGIGVLYWFISNLKT